MYSPCIYDISLGAKSAPCSDSESCKSDVRTHATSHTPAQARTLTPIGLAKDGRVIYGPFTASGLLWQPCDVDVCNGKMFTNNYGYVATMFHPYIVGCWGPGNNLKSLGASCSDNPRICG